MRKPVLGIIRHPFKRTVPVAELFHAVRVCADEPLRTQGAPLKGMDEFVEMKRLVTRPNPLYKIRVLRSHKGDLDLQTVIPPIQQ